MAVKKPNTLCKNVNCTKGKDGGRKHYYSCSYCAHEENWRSLACSWECYMEFNDQLMKARNKGTVGKILPERTDMSMSEVEILMETPLEQVVERTEMELAEEIEAHPHMGFDEIVDQINAEMDKTTE